MTDTETNHDGEPRYLKDFGLYDAVEEALYDNNCADIGTRTESGQTYIIAEIDVTAVQQAVDELHYDIKHYPVETAGEGFKKILREDAIENDQYTDESGEELRYPLKIEYVNPPEDLLIDLTDDNHDKSGQLVSIRGTCLHKTNNEAELTRVVYECSCGERYPGSGKINVSRGQMPDESRLKCPYCEHTGKMEIDHDESDKTSSQYLKIQQMPDQLDGDSNPRDIEVYVRGRTRTEQTDVGRETVAVGILKHEQKYDDSPQLRSFLRAISVRTTERTDADLTPTEEEREEIERIVKMGNGDAEGNMLDEIASRIAPHIVGRDAEKKLIWLQAVGCDWFMFLGNKVRGNIHLMLIGDASTGKTDLLNAAMDINPKSVKADGNNSSQVGLLAAAVDETVAGRTKMVLKSGALPLADGGICGIDELDKMDGETSLNTALSQGEISVSKGGINGKLKTRCDTIMTANPIHGDFDPHDPITDQFGFDSTLLSRMDVVIPFEEDRDNDDLIAESIHKKFAQANKEVSADGGENPHDLLRKYAYITQQKPMPDVSDEAGEILGGFYEGMRAGSLTDGGNIKSRHLEGLYRLSFAHCRSRMGEKVLPMDVREVLDVWKPIMKRKGHDFAEINNGAKAVEPQQDRIAAVVSALRDLDNPDESVCVSVDDVAEELETNMPDKQLRSCLDTLSNKNPTPLNYKPDQGKVTIIDV